MQTSGGFFYTCSFCAGSWSTLHVMSNWRREHMQNNQTSFKWVIFIFTVPNQRTQLTLWLLLSSDVQECGTIIDNCHTDANCTNTKGSFSCTCHSGYSGDGVACNGMTYSFNLKFLVTSKWRKDILLDFFWNKELNYSNIELISYALFSNGANQLL